MPWYPDAPDGTQSVQDNETILQANTTYIKTEMKDDHFWDEDSDKDGRHRQVQMPKQGSDPMLGAKMDGVIYYKEDGTSDNRVQGFYRNESNIYQFIPAFITGTVALTTSYATVSAVPDETYGQIWLWIDDTSDSCVMGWFRAYGGVVHGFTPAIFFGNSKTATREILLGNNNEVSALNLQARVTSTGTAGDYQYRLIYWAM